ncbi:MAG: hypothetical protein AAB420_01955 [Patescibacteria group bacterium]
MTIFTTPEKTKELAKSLRRQGYSYAEIQERLSVPKSTLGNWLKSFQLTPPQQERVARRRREGARAGAWKKIENTIKSIREIRESSVHDIKQISTRELWLMGIILYGRERLRRERESDLRKGVSFTSSDDFQIKLFLRWLLEIGKLSKDDILFDIFLKEEHRNNKHNILLHWSRITKSPASDLNRIYFFKQTSHRYKQKRQSSPSSPFGLLRIRVRASSLLARQIAGWMRGISSII